MNAIFLNKIKLNLNFETQLSPSGRPIRLSAISKNLKVPAKWVKENNKNVLKYHWIYTFRYIDDQDGFVSFEFDYNDKFLQKL
jgi:hypothetical protein